MPSACRDQAGGVLGFVFEGPARRPIEIALVSVDVAVAPTDHDEPDLAPPSPPSSPAPDVPARLSGASIVRLCEPIGHGRIHPVTTL